MLNNLNECFNMNIPKSELLDKIKVYEEYIKEELSIIKSIVKLKNFTFIDLESLQKSTNRIAFYKNKIVFLENLIEDYEWKNK